MIILIATASFAKAPNASGSKMKTPYAKGEVIVVLKKGKEISDINSSLSRSSIRVVKSYKSIASKSKSSYLLIKGNLPTQKLVAKLKSNPNVKSASPNYRRKLNLTPNDPKFSDLWALNNIGQPIRGTAGTDDADINAVEAWDIESNASNTVVVVFDTGVDYNHEDLRRNIWINSVELNGAISVDDDNNGYIDDIYGYDFASDNDGGDDSDPMDIHGHGTHIAGTIGAVGDNGVGVVGVNWDVKIMAIKVFRPELHNYDSDVLEAIDYVLKMKSRGVNIVAINASYGAMEGEQADPMNGAIASLGDAGIVFVAAAGNDDVDTDVRPHYPSSYSAYNILSVAATDYKDKLAWFSNFGSTSVDLAAPGVNILSTYPGGADVDRSIFFDDVESGVGNWISYGANNSWSITQEDANSSTHAWTDSPNNKYKDDTNASLAYDSDIDLTAYFGESIGLGACMIYELEKGYHDWMLWDKVLIEVSADSGNSWALLQELGDKQSSWKCTAYAIPNAYKTANFRMRFRITTDGSTVYDGIYIDNIAIGRLSPSKRYGYSSGTSMASPYVVGTVALMAAQYPDENTSYQIARILGGVDKMDNLSQKVVVGGRLNIYKSIELSLVAPVGVDDNASTDEDNNITVSVLSNDSSLNGNSLSIVNLTTPAKGKVSINGADIIYVPNADFNGIDSFKYSPNNGLLNGNKTTVTITINPINDRPIATEDNISTREDINVSISVLDNDIDIDSNTLTITSVAKPANGIATIDNKSITYSPNIGFNGIDKFIYTISDGNMTASASVNVAVSPVNSIPTAYDKNITINEDSVNIPIVLSGQDADGDTLTYIIVSNPSNGTLSGTEANIKYTPNTNFSGTDSFTYKINDSTVDSNIATVTILVNSDIDTDDNDDILDKNDSTPLGGGSGGGCTYNPNNKDFDFMLILMIFATILYSARQKYSL